jgi:hypothetical protein
MTTLLGVQYHLEINTVSLQNTTLVTSEGTLVNGQLYPPAGIKYFEMTKQNILSAFPPSSHEQVPDVAALANGKMPQHDLSLQCEHSTQTIIYLKITTTKNLYIYIYLLTVYCLQAMFPKLSHYLIADILPITNFQ